MAKGGGEPKSTKLSGVVQRRHQERFVGATGKRNINTKKKQPDS